MNDTFEVILFDIVDWADDEWDAPQIQSLRELWRGSADEARRVYADEPEVLEELERLVAAWPNRRPGETELTSRIGLGAGGEFVLSLESPVTREEDLW